MSTTHIIPAASIFTCQSNGEVAHLKQHALLIEGDKIVAVEPVQLPASAPSCTIIPGLVNPHTHMFQRVRYGEFDDMCAGVPYNTIRKQGGGIQVTVNQLKTASDDELDAMIHQQLAVECYRGHTTVELKSGYALSTEGELRLLRAAKRVRDQVAQHVIITFLGAHLIPDTYKDNPDAYVDSIIHDMLPVIQHEGLADRMDVFPEGGFSTDQSRRLLQAGVDAGLRLTIHGDQMQYADGVALACEFAEHVDSIDHLYGAKDEHLTQLAAANIIGTLLPGCELHSNPDGRYPDAGRWRQLGVEVAIATNYNPGSSLINSQGVMAYLAARKCGLSAAHSFRAMTYSAGRALRRPVGALLPGYSADFLILNRHYNDVKELVMDGAQLDAHIKHVYIKGHCVK